MLDPFATLKDAGFSEKSGRSVDTLAGWSPELIASLDWARLSELARGIATEAGCEVAGSRVMPDGAVLFGMLEQPKSAKPRRAMVKIAPWNEWGATPETVRRCADEVSTARDTRGILIAPAGFNPAALRTAQERRIEAVDAVAMNAALQALHEDKREFLLAMIAKGDYSTPTCPVCLRKLRRVQLEQRSLPSRVIDTVGLIADPVLCDQLEIARGCDATFLQEVRARSITVSGHAAGDFVCEGPVTLKAGGTLSGTVAARSLDVQDGGELLGQFRILGGELGSFVKPTMRWDWRCGGAENKRCATVVFEPHE